MNEVVVLTPERILEVTEDVLRRLDWRRPPWSTLPARSMSATAASIGIFRARLRCARRWPSAGSNASTRRLQKIAEGSGPAPAQARTLAAHAVRGQAEEGLEDPEMFATYLTLAREACDVVKAHKDGLVDQIASILSDGVKQGAFEVADVKASARAIFDATMPLPSSGACRGMERSGTRGADRCVAGAVAEGPGSPAQALDRFFAVRPRPFRRAPAAAALRIAEILAL